jgi:hypothetical protein
MSKIFRNANFCRCALDGVSVFIIQSVAKWLRASGKYAIANENNYQ